MNIKPLHQRFSYFACLLVLLLLTACGGPEEPARQENTATEEESQNQTKSPTQAAVAPDEAVKLDEMLYPDTEFLFEMYGIGGPMMPWRFYAVQNTSAEQVADFYRERLPWFDVQTDEIAEGHRYLYLEGPDALEKIGEAEDADEMAEIGDELDGALLGVNVSHSTAHLQADYGLNMLNFAINAGHADEIPDDTTIIVLVYFNNPY